ncbi:hypothetical protein J3Q64DRAFT_1111557 [Phycomyces blakesleeanus]|uniref:Uncharacterized protein n=1 Tax=Phycomyces blakesleeanus TaxID=4837 RepID=A0ABR3AY11_PHYBL
MVFREKKTDSGIDFYFIYKSILHKYITYILHTTIRIIIIIIIIIIKQIFLVFILFEPKICGFGSMAFFLLLLLSIKIS